MTAREYDFRVRISQNGVRCNWDTPTSQGHEKHTPRIHLDQHLVTIRLLEEWLERWDWIARGENSESLLVPDTFKVLGDHLWRMALSEVPGTDLINAINTVRESLDQPKPRVRVHIGFTNDAVALAALPWEFVHVSGARSFFLATETVLTLARYVEGPGFHEPIGQSPDDKLRVLFVAILPTGGEHGTAYDCERAAIRKLSEDLNNRGMSSRIETNYYEGSNFEEVAAALRESRGQRDGGQIDVVHVAALFHPSGGALQLYRPDNRGQWWWRKADSLVRAITRDRETQPKLVILHLCDWHEAPDEGNLPEHFEQLAPEFISHGVSAVLAMQYPMRPTDVRGFLTDLYNRLADGEPIAAAVQATRIDLEVREDRYFGSPVLYMQSRVDASLVRRTSVGGEEETGADTERRPTSLHPIAPPVREVKVELVEAVKDLPETDARNDLLSWIEKSDWPLSVTDPMDRTSVETKISLKAREQNDKREAVEILEKLRKRVGKLARPSGEW